MKKTKITLFEGNGSALVGGGSIQLEYDKWASNPSNNIELNHFIPYQNEECYYPRVTTRHNRVLNNVFTFFYGDESDYLASNKAFSEAISENLIILTFPTIGNEGEDVQLSFLRLLLRKHKSYYKEKSNVIVVCYDYAKDVCLNNLGAKYPDLFQFVDTVWVNNEKNPLVEHLVNCGVSYDKFYFDCPQFIADANDGLRNIEIMRKWKHPKEMALSQLYYSGRTLDWKGHQYLSTLQSQLWKAGLEMNATINGYSIEDGTIEKNTLIEDGFSKNKTLGVKHYGNYSPDDIEKLSSQAGFSFYYTLLGPSKHFFPEYTLIDAISNGSVLIVPEWYFHNYPSAFNERVFSEDLTPEKAGMLVWNPNNSEKEIEVLKEQIKALQKNNWLYNEYRERALKTILKYFGGNAKIRKALAHKERK